MPRLCSLLVAGYLLISLLALLHALVNFLKGCLRRPRAVAGRPTEAATVPEWAFRAPDPLIYSQEWLMSQGLAVTWQNPDIHLELPAQPGVPVDSWTLQPKTVYRIIARVWNGSPVAPVADLPVEMSYLDFGIGGVAVPIASTKVDLPAKGAVGTPAFATVEWKTPPTPGHYCLQVRLVWPHDANPKNNMGQHNVDVQPLNSPKATFKVPVRNPGREAVEVRLRADGYALPELRPCDQSRPTPADHAPERHPIPKGWEVDLGDASDGLRLKPKEEAEVTVTLIAPDGFAGRRAVNIAGFVRDKLIGGVTLIAAGEADA